MKKRRKSVGVQERARRELQSATDSLTGEARNAALGLAQDMARPTFNWAPPCPCWSARRHECPLHAEKGEQ